MKYNQGEDHQEDHQEDQEDHSEPDEEEMLQETTSDKLVLKTDVLVPDSACALVAVEALSSEEQDVEETASLREELVKLRRGEDTVSLEVSRV